MPDDLFEQADNLAHALGISRSGLYALALKEYLSRHSAGAVTERLNQIYGDRDSTLSGGLERAQDEFIEDEGW